MSQEDRKNAAKGNWEEDFPSEDEKEASKKISLPFVKFDGPGKEYDFRLVGSYVSFLRYYEPFGRQLITHDSYGDEDPVRAAGFWPSTQYAIHVIDRRDGKLKILQKGKSIFENFKNFKSREGIDPAGKDAPDFTIVVKGSGLNTRYSVDARRDSAPVTADELAMIKEQHLSLKEIFKSASLAYIKQEWDKLPEDKKIPPKRESKGDDGSGDSPSAKSSAKIEDIMSDSPADSDDEFASATPSGKQDQLW